MSTRVRPEVAQRLAVLLAPVLLTLPRFWNGFVFDDVFMIVQGDFIHDWRNLSRAFGSHAMIASSLESAVGTVPVDTYRPISIASFFWDSALSGRAPWAYHLTNTVLHALNCVLVLELMRRLCVRASSSLLVGCALLFGLAPWLSEAHVFINGRSDLFLALFMLSAVLLQRLAIDEARPGLAVAAGALALLGLLSKETAVLMLPFVVLVPTAAPAQLTARVKYAVPLCTAFALYLVMREAALHGLRTHANTQHLWLALANVPLLWADALVHILLPLPYVLRNLRDDYAPLAVAVRLAALLVLVGTLASIAVAFRRRAYAAAWGLGMALCTLAPTAMITTELWQGFGRYLYLPAVGVFVAVCYGLAQPVQVSERGLRLLHRMVFVLAAASALLLVDSVLGFHDDLRLYRRAQAEAPEQAWTHGSIGLALKREGQCGAAVALLARGATMAPQEPRYLVQLARCLVELGELERAREVALEGQRRFSETRAEAGFLVAEFLTLPRSSIERPTALMERCLRLSPGRADCVEGLAAVRALARRTAPTE